ncbi:MAG: selenide, water dikinase SelD [Candidatus Marinimicrobia bacterium]|nr:selenide, water dikinase SelD [Candidatus Neomarinimicrobiota bacterium]MCF7851065.1 selenide, water dikinase SelD [Candidatus Neomarinimicrobiota bacterium]MCF7904035.1 selenide, water dikinase SelD [Candidatus Neomarinimicrobiota bacterium]
MSINSHPDLLVGLDNYDDSAVYQLSEDLAIVQSLDFFTPIVDDPYTFGQITAANALSDIYAMGATPKTALNIVAFPIETMDKSILKDILQGGISKVEEAGAVLAGGHSVKDDELKYGLSVTGIVHPQKMISNKGAQPGDFLVLTKALGTGIVATALKRKLAPADQIDAMVKSMVQLNKGASEAAVKYQVHAMTDVTGYGLVGHLLEMLRASEVNAQIFTDKLPILPGTIEWIKQKVVPGGLKTNYKFFRPFLDIASGLDDTLVSVVVDAQTSGGLLMSATPKDAESIIEHLQAQGDDQCRIVGEISDRSPNPKVTLI